MCVAAKALVCFAALYYREYYKERKENESKRKVDKTEQLSKNAAEKAKKT